MKVDWLGPTNFVEQSPSWTADNFSTSHEISCIVLNLKDHYCVHNSPRTYPCPDPDQSSPNSTIHFLEIRFNISSHLCQGVPSCLFPLVFHQILYACTSLVQHMCHVPLPVIFLDLFTQIIFGED